MLLITYFTTDQVLLSTFFFIIADSIPPNTKQFEASGWNTSVTSFTDSNFSSAWSLVFSNLSNSPEFQNVLSFPYELCSTVRLGTNTAGWDFVVVFIRYFSKVYCSELVSSLINITEWLIQIRVYIDAFFMTLYFYSSSTATRTLTFRYMKWTPDVNLTGSLLDIVVGQYVRQGMCLRTATKNAE